MLRHGTEIPTDEGKLYLDSVLDMGSRRIIGFAPGEQHDGLHCAALRYEETDWAAVVRFYERLITVTPTPVVALNRAVVIAETKGSTAGHALLDDIAEDLDGYHLLHALRDQCWKGWGDRAAAMARTDAEVSFLSLRRTQLTVDDPGAD